MKLNNTINTEIVEVQTYSWDSYGNTIADPMVALCELVHNGIAASLSDPVNRRVDIDISKRRNGTFLSVRNTGAPANIENVLHYGKKNHGTVYNQFGTGFKTATSFFNPTNDGWAFYTNDNGRFFYVKAPYSNKMEIIETSAWDLPNWVVSCAEIRIDDIAKLEGITAEALGYHYSLAIENGININFCGKKVKPIKPHGAASSDTRIVEINGEPVTIDYTLYTLGEDAKKDEYYTKGLNGQGLYIFANNCLASHINTGVIRKTGGKGFLKSHPSMNHVVAIVNIHTPANHKADIPFINNKSNISWKNKNGEEYRAIIDELVGQHFRDAYDDALESERRKCLDKFCETIMIGTLMYEKEYEITKKCRADAVLGFEKNAEGHITPESIKKIVEFKPKKVTYAHVGQAYGYYCQLRAQYGIKPQLFIVGKEFEQEALNYISILKNENGVEVHTFDWSPFFTM